jgi:hypothetical protein
MLIGGVVWLALAPVLRSASAAGERGGSAAARAGGPRAPAGASDCASLGQAANFAVFSEGEFKPRRPSTDATATGLARPAKAATHASVIGPAPAFTG